MPLDTIWASVKTDWHAEAVCAGANDYQFFPKLETPALLDKVRGQFCDHCPVRAKCLNSALINNDTGFWGGTSTAERQAMKKARRRATCPLCRSNALVTVDTVEQDPAVETGSAEPYQVCVACGASWRSKSLLRLVTDQDAAVEGTCP